MFIQIILKKNIQVLQNRGRFHFKEIWVSVKFIVFAFLLRKKNSLTRFGFQSKTVTWETNGEKTLYITSSKMSITDDLSLIYKHMDQSIVLTYISVTLIQLFL
jgi:hypothetical protein